MSSSDPQPRRPSRDWGQRDSTAQMPWDTEEPPCEVSPGTSCRPWFCAFLAGGLGRIPGDPKPRVAHLQDTDGTHTINPTLRAQTRPCCCRDHCQGLVPLKAATGWRAFGSIRPAGAFSCDRRASRTGPDPANEGGGGAHGEGSPWVRGPQRSHEKRALIL